MFKFKQHFIAASLIFFSFLQAKAADNIICSDQLRVVQVKGLNSVNFLTAVISKGKIKGTVEVELRTYDNFTNSFGNTQFLRESGYWLEDYVKAFPNKRIIRVYGDDSLPTFKRTLLAKAFLKFSQDKKDAILILSSDEDPLFSFELSFQNGELVSGPTKSNGPPVVLESSDVKYLGVTIPYKFENEPSPTGRAASKDRILFFCGDMSGRYNIKMFKSWDIPVQ